MSGAAGGHDRAPRHDLRPGALRFALPALLVILVLAGLRGAAAAPGLAGRNRHDGTVIGAATEILLAALLIVLLIRGRRPLAGTFMAARLRTMLTYLITAGLIAIPVVLLFDSGLRTGRRRTKPRRLRLPHQPPPRATAKPRPHPALHIPWAALLYGLLIAVLLAAVIVCAVLLSRRRHPGPSYELGDDIGDDSDELRAAVESGQSALRRVDDARAAIIASYAAMELSLARAGAARAVAETPDELLARAVGAGLARGGAAARLTALFYEARFSSHPLGQDERDAAGQALSEIAADLDRPRAAGAASGAASGAAGDQP